MAVKFYHTTFKNIRQSYVEVMAFLQERSFADSLCLDSKIEADLGLRGDDNADLLQEFVTTYKLSVEGFNYDKHFLSEGEFTGTYGVFVTAITVIVWSIYYLIKIFSFNLVKVKKPNMKSFFYRETTDLTFGDLVTWHLLGKFESRNEVHFTLQKSA